jgi:hypothetical protein
MKRAPRLLLLLGAVILVAFVVARLSGIRPHVATLSGSVGDPSLGTLYVALHLGAVAIAPILLLAGILLAIHDRLQARRRR